MKRMKPLAFALTLGLAAAGTQAKAADTSPVKFREGSRVVVVGRVSSPPEGAVNEKKMQVAVGPARTDYTLHFRDARLIGLAGQKDG